MCFQEKKSCMHIMFDPFIMLVKGWRVYARQKVVFAGLSLSFLYMTVLGFDSITLGRCLTVLIYEQFISRNIFNLLEMRKGQFHRYPRYIFE